MKIAATLLAVLLISSFVGASTAVAVGYERYDVPASAQPEPKAGGQSAPSLYKAIQNATFVEKYPAIIDEVAMFVRDVLSQFGLDKKTP
ncbi:MAG: hypothetical protein WCG29_06775 [Desulfomonile sp.]|jgi:hypothetical protein|nr:hypothetical protein [Deltaproteobacteria bacterium]